MENEKKLSANVAGSASNFRRDGTMEKIICWIFGHVAPDTNRGFSFRYGICQRCGKYGVFKEMVDQER